MKSFLLNIVALSSLVVLVLTLSLFFVPDKVSETSILAALHDKHDLLKNTTGQKIILAGGSNVSFGMDSKRLSEELGKPVVNMGLHGGLGLQFILSDLKKYAKAGDIVILLPEYEYFYTDNLHGEMELVSVLFDVEPEAKKQVGSDQWMHLLKYLPSYSAKKIKNYVSSFFSSSARHTDIYHRSSFNEFGDACLHWNLPNQDYLHATPVTGSEVVNRESIALLKDFKAYANEQKITFMIFPPVIDSTSYKNEESVITKIDKELKQNDLALLEETSAYRYPDSLFFNSYYHLNKRGVDKRTLELGLRLKNCIE